MTPATTSPVSPQQMQNAKANLALLLLSLGIPLLILASYSLLRASLFEAGTQQPPAPLQPAPTTSPWQSSPEIHPPLSFGSGQNSGLIPVPTATGTEEPFDRDVPVVSGYQVVIPDDPSVISRQPKGGYETHSGLRGGK